MITNAPKSWNRPTVNTECSLHQLSPYIGKLKSKIARDLLLKYSNSGDIIVDPFSGAGTIPLEAILNGRYTFASDISPYSKILTLAKLFPPPTYEDACNQVGELLKKSNNLKAPDLRKVPLWVRKFFHPKTLKEIINFSIICRKNGNEFFFACLLGILHHQRPGFLSHPSSHLVPYLKSKKFPREGFMDMYKYRELQPRILAKIKRAFLRAECPPLKCFWRKSRFLEKPIQELKLLGEIDCLITSPPYMNVLDYLRDNRLRLWFINPKRFKDCKVKEPTSSKEAFQECIISLSRMLEESLVKKGHAVLIIGERISKRNAFNISEWVVKTISDHSPSMQLVKIIKDVIPDVRRSRRDCRGTKVENILVFRKS